MSAFLMASYLYYIRFQSVITDPEYDMLTQVLLENWNNFEHMHKHLATREDLKAGTLYALGEDKYPLIVKGAADLWLRASQEGKMAGD